MRQLHSLKTRLITLTSLLFLLTLNASADVGCYHDTQPPVAVCDGHTVVSLTSDGTATLYATSIDDGSHDNCEIWTMKVARMTQGWCPYGVVDDTQFRPYVQFCCEDIGAPVWIIFRVWDKAGNYNDCMVEVSVQDKLPPSIHCPYDKTIYCNSPYDPNEMWDPYSPTCGSASAYDNCGLEQIYVNVIGSTTCGQGHIKRIFTAVDWGGQVSKCTQNIWIVDPHPFTKYDITWPWDYETSGCSYAGTDPDELPYRYDRPRWSDTDCSLIGAAYKDLEFHFVDGVCSKILRTWTVIDWCQFDPYSHYSTGIWEHVQIIKLIDHDKPQFENCKDTTILGLESTCAGRVVLDPKVWDICTPKDQLGYEYKVDKYHNGSIDIIRKDKPILDEVLPVGVHKVYWYVDDGCGNRSSCTYIVKVEDGKAPSPVCYAQLSTVVMPIGGMVTIWARDFNASSFDNCTQANKLKYSFSSNVLETSRTFNCDDVGVNILEIWVTDQSGNQAYCSTWLTIGDNLPTCSQMNPLSGAITTFSGTSVSDASVALYIVMPDESMEMDKIEQSGLDGFYLTGFGTTNFDRMIGAEKEGDPIEGISGLDLVMLQQHIVGTNPITDPAALYAADVDGSGHVGVSDLLMLRDAFLSGGRTLNGKKLDWIFYPNDCAWGEGSFAPDCNVMVEIDRFNPPSEEIDFVGVKKGDINGDMRTELTGRGRGYNIDLRVVESQMGSKVNFIAAQDMDISGLQISLQSGLFHNDNTTNFESGVIRVASGAHYIDTDMGSLNILWLAGREQVLTEGSTLFSLDIQHARGVEVQSKISLTGNMKDRAYTFDQRPASLDLRWLDDDMVYSTAEKQLSEGTDDEKVGFINEAVIRDFDELEVVPNPMRDQTKIYFSAELDVKGRIELYSADLKLVWSQKMAILPGTNSIDIFASDLVGPGVYYFRITGGNHTSTGRFIQLD